MSEILKPCPFCGSKYTQVRYIGWKSPSAFDSGYRGECCYCGLITAAYHTEAEAIDAWNTRAERTCTNTKMDGSYFMCSRCHAAFDMLDWEGEPVIWVDDIPQFNSYCPHCGAKVVDE